MHLTLSRSEQRNQMTTLTFTLSDGESSVTHVGTLDSAREAAERWAAGDWGDNDSTIWVDVTIRDDNTGKAVDTVTVAIDPDEPPCIQGEEHDWQAPHDLVGGLDENPGVVGHGGGVLISEVCMHCGCGRKTDTWAQRPDTGEQGLVSLTYTKGEYTNAVSA